MTSASTSHEPRQGGTAGDHAGTSTREQGRSATGGASGPVVAVLYAYADGPYAGLDGVDVWDASRDARTYRGDAPVVAHPPCSRWCQLAHVNQKRYGHRVGEDGGCFASALAAVRRCGGVLEHPANSYAWPAFRLPRPRAGGGWSRDIVTGEWVCEVAQVAYKHAARKLTWLLYVGDVAPPELDWSRPAATAQVSWCANHGCSELPRIGKRKASETPIAFRDALLAMARGSRLGAA